MKRILSAFTKSGLVFLLVLGGRTCWAQITLTANPGGNTQNTSRAAIVFAIENTNSAPVTIEEIGIQRRTNSITCDFHLWYYNGTGSELTGTSPTITTANGWTNAMTVTSVAPPAANSIQTIMTNVNIVIPAHTTYRFAVEADGRSGSPFNVASCSDDTSVTTGGVTLWTGENTRFPGLVGSLPSPGTQCRPFSGSITFSSGSGGGCVAPAIPVITAASSTICTGGNTTLTISSGNLNDATAWHWYEGSCGGTPIGTGTSVNVAPAATAMYYVRGEGGCVTPGVCASSRVEVTGAAIPSVTVNVMPANVVCAGDVVMFSALTGNGGPMPSYQWKKNGVDVGANSPAYMDSTLSSGNTITCVLTSSLSCASPATATSQPVTMTVHALPAVPVITVSNTTLTSSEASGNQWYLGETALPGATGQSHTATETGWYRVSVTDSATGCSSMSDSVHIITWPAHIGMFTGNTTIQVYPNPFTDRLTIEAGAATGDREVQITDQLGRRVHTQRLYGDGEALHVAHLQPGVYFVLVHYNHTREVFKVVKY